VNSLVARLLREPLVRLFVRHRYRGMKSFRTTKWDAKENLPSDYSKIYQLPHFRAMVKQIRADQEQQAKNHQADSAQVGADRRHARSLTSLVSGPSFH
jgi:hypothetical protein